MMNKIGSVNPCNILYLFNFQNKCIGYCLDTPNAFACACSINNSIMKGVANYSYFDYNIRLSNDVDIIDRQKMYKNLSTDDLNNKKIMFQINFY